MTNPRRPSSPRGGVGPDRTAPRRFAARRGFARSDWSEVRDRVDLAGVATRLMGPPPGRRGEAGKRLWWPCPFHDDANPSFCVEPEKPWWRCYGCGDHGDAIALAMKYRRMSFREAMGFVLGDATLEPRPRWPRGKPRPEPDETPAPPGDVRDEDIRRIVDGAAKRLWLPEGWPMLWYLRGRGLNDATIRAARLGYTPGASALKRDGTTSHAKFEGLTIPWFGRDGLELVKVRQFDDRQPRYAEIYRRNPTTYPGPALSPMPTTGAVVIVEGELDALLLGQELEGLATVLTLGSASSRPPESLLDDLHAALRVFIATDADAAGDRSAAGWPSRAVRVRPPEPHKDWTEAHVGEIVLRRWWVPWLFTDPYEPEERAAILEYDGGLDRKAAEWKAGVLPLSDPAEEPAPVGFWQRPLPPERAAALARGDALRAAGLALPEPWYPEPQEKFVHPPMPGPREDGKPWWE